MATLFSDDFSAALGTRWTIIYGSWAASGGVVTDAASGPIDSMFTTTASHAAVADCKVTVKRVSGTGWDAGPCVRASGNYSHEQFYYLDVYGTNTFDVFRTINGSDTLVDTRTATIGNGDTYGLSVSGTGASVTLKVFHNGSQLGADIVDSNAARIVTAGQTGLCQWGSSTHTYDNFLVEDLEAGGPTVSKSTRSHPKGIRTGSFRGMGGKH